jgi:GrpB-like predicted nucleotidyltransferase (UPF0157 family)
MPDRQPMTDEQIIRATVGPRAEHNATVTLVDYEPAWRSMYEDVALRVRDSLGDRVLRLEHVGSTSVPGLCAKPSIDMLLVVADTRDEASYFPEMETAGFILHAREPEWFEHRLFHASFAEIKLHTFCEGCSEIERMLVFRDWLRSHPEDCDLYAATKRDLAARTWKYVQNYADAKSGIVDEILDRAGSNQPRP